MNIAEPLSILINLSFEKAFYFGNMMISKVIPVYKDKGNILGSSNYRSISLLSDTNKYYRIHFSLRVIVFTSIKWLYKESFNKSCSY